MLTGFFVVVGAWLVVRRRYCVHTRATNPYICILNDVVNRIVYMRLHHFVVRPPNVNGVCTECSFVHHYRIELTCSNESNKNRKSISKWGKCNPHAVPFTVISSRDPVPSPVSRLPSHGIFNSIVIL